MRRWLRRPRHANRMRAIRGAQADHRDDPSVPTETTPEAEAVRSGAWADIQIRRERGGKTRRRTPAPWKAR